MDIDVARPRPPREDRPHLTGEPAGRAGRAGRRPRRGLAAHLDDAAVAVAARTGVTPRAVVGLVLVAVLVAALLGARVVLAQHRSVPVPLAPARVGTPLVSSTATGAAPVAQEAGAAGASPGVGGATAPATTRPEVVVHVVGQVRRAGVVTLPAGSRVQDALTAAGGATRGADLTAVNLARLVVDGEQVVVPRPGEAVVPAAGAADPAGGSGAAAGGAGSGGTGGAGGSPAVVNLNAATAEQLDALPGVGPVLAGRIVDWRAQHGRFTSVDELGEVSGIGDKVMERLRPLVRV